MVVVLVTTTPVDGSVPIQVPTALRASKTAPRAVLPPASTAMPLLEVPLTPEARSAGLYFEEEFPSEPQPRPNVNQEPLPLSPPGTYLHSAVLIQGVMYIYGGVASYEADKYFNDLWLFDFGASEFVQLQGNYVPPPPTRAGLSAGDAEAFAPTDVPEMPNLATAPRHETSTAEALHPEANPSSPFLPTRRAQHPVRVTALEHLYLKDAEKPTAAGLTMKQIYGQAHSEKPAFMRDQERDALKRKIAKQRKEYERLEKQLKEQEQEEAKAEAEKRKVLGHSFLETGVEIGAETAVRHRHRMLSSVLKSIIDARRAKNPSTAEPRDNSGTVYSDARFHRDGVAADYHFDGRPIQDAAEQQHHPNTRTPESAVEDERERMPHALQDFWAYDLDEHTWTLANVSSSQPLAHSPWLTPASAERSRVQRSSPRSPPAYTPPPYSCGNEGSHDCVRRCVLQQSDLG